jgi:hypothetical protein
VAPAGETTAVNVRGWPVVIGLADVESTVVVFVFPAFTTCETVLEVAGP